MLPAPFLHNKALLVSCKPFLKKVLFETFKKHTGSCLVIPEKMALIEQSAKFKSDKVFDVCYVNIDLI